MRPPLAFRSPDDAGGGNQSADKSAGAQADKGTDDRDKLIADLKAQIAKDAADRKKGEDAAAAKRGEFEKLYNETKASADASAAKLAELEARETERIKAVEKRNATRVKDVPEERRSLVPLGLPAEALADWLDTNAALLKGEDLAAGTRTRSTTATGEITDAHVEAKHPEVAAEARTRGLAPSQWFAILKKAGRKFTAEA